MYVFEVYVGRRVKLVFAQETVLDEPGDRGTLHHVREPAPEPFAIQSLRRGGEADVEGLGISGMEL